MYFKIESNSTLDPNTREQKPGVISLLRKGVVEQLIIPDIDLDQKFYIIYLIIFQMLILL